ncbi:MAG: choice-of-anchor J domain-containing protein [Prevotella sp.]|nr:choice-of-anchor J domain-containing protein [Prevotella sp.]
MKKLYTAFFALMALATATTQAQTILEEDFETGATKSQSTPLTRGEGWTVVSSYSGTNYRYNWFNEYRDPESQSGATISGAGCAACDGPTGGTAPDGMGPREEILLSPELDLNDNYQLQFSWKVSPMNNRDNSQYDIQVRVVTGGNLNAAETVFSIHNEDMLRESGVAVFPIDTWDVHTSKIDLSDFKGEKVKLAFVYKMQTTIANVVWIDDITVKKFTPATGPVASINLDRYDFKEVYIGEKRYSEVFTLTNVGKNGLQITGFDLPAGVTTTLDASKVNLRTYDKVSFQLAYEASLTSAPSGDAIIHTTGGDVKIAVSAKKQFVPKGYMLETFNAYFPPAGWKNNGWSATKTAIEGDQSAYCSGNFSNSILRSPRLDLSEGGTLKFTYYNQYDGESAPEYDIELQVSYDGGDNWTTKWTSDYQNGLNQLLTAEVDLGMGSDESYVRWYYPAIESDDEGAYDHSNFTLDGVLLPNVYGADGVPGNATIVSPANNAQNIYPKNIKLEWAPAQFAKGYKVYVGSNNEVNNLVNGADVMTDLSIVIPQADYETTYKWKVVAYNDNGESTTASTWKFTTQPDASVMEFPWSENFDECTKENPIPTGWLSTTTITDLYPTWTNRRWEPLNTSKAYGGTGVSMYTMWLYAGYSSTLTSPEFNLPSEGKAMSISFVWGDNHPASLIVDETGLLKKQNVPGGNGASDLVFEIYADGEWHQAAYLSENMNADGDTKYWRNESVDLSEYAGKKVQFRWINNAYSGAHKGAALDNIVIDGIVDDYVMFNKEGWDAEKVNSGKGKKSTDITMLNKGKNAQKVKSVTFTTNDFQSSIAAGTEIAVNEGIAFNVTFTANQEGKKVDDVMTVEFESGLKADFPVTGEALAEDVLYYGFEDNSLDYDWTADFTQKDVDGQTNYKSNYYLTVVENDGGRYAFTQAYHSNPNLTAHSGQGTAAACAPDNNSAANDWLISKMIRPLEGASFDFYARNLGTTNSVFVGDNDLHSVEVLVSETSNTDTKTFTTVMPTTEMAYLPENQWHHFNVDLSAYVGKNIYVAVRHTTVSANWFAFFDDFTFTHVGEPDFSAIKSVKALNADTQVVVYNANGMIVAKGAAAQTMDQLGKGMYVVKTADGQVMKTFCK